MLMKNHTAFYLLALILAGFLASCGGGAPTAPLTPATVTPTEHLSVPTEVAATIPVETVASVPAAPTSPSVSFVQDVLPILQQNCSNCHGGSKASGGFQINTYQAVMAGSRTGTVIQPGDGQNSYLVQLVQKGTMPRRGPKLPGTEIQIIIDWINAGALDN
jgi:mono/diheme cytochrome c family protein